MWMNNVDIERIRKAYPKGTIVKLDYMDDPYAPPSGTKGVVQSVDDIGQIHVHWENGSGLALNLCDCFSVVKE